MKIHELFCRAILGALLSSFGTYAFAESSVPQILSEIPEAGGVEQQPGGAFEVSVEHLGDRDGVDEFALRINSSHEGMALIDTDIIWKVTYAKVIDEFADEVRIAGNQASSLQSSRYPKLLAMLAPPSIAQLPGREVVARPYQQIIHVNCEGINRAKPVDIELTLNSYIDGKWSLKKYRGQLALDPNRE